MKTLDRILLIVGLFDFVFVAVMVALFCVKGSVPDTLVTCVFAATLSECGVCGWIKTTKDRVRERAWEVEDKKDVEETKEP